MMIYLLSCNPKIKQFNTMEKHTQGFDDCQINDHHCKYEKLISDVVDWADDKGLVKEENSDKQLIKVIEEVGELASAILKKKRKEEIDAVGDIMVTLIIFAEIRGYDVMSALGYAYQEIKDRTGKMVDGSFIKD
jgi:NTP pyrophosphatase (non-canonical NTP hydrolase)